MGFKSWIARNLLGIKLPEPISDFEQRVINVEAHTGILEADNAFIKRTNKRILTQLSREGGDESAAEDSPLSQYLPLLKQLGINSPEDLKPFLEKLTGKPKTEEDGYL